MSQTTAFTPRKGQQDLIEYLPQIQRGDTLTVQWPTGYGKSIGFALVWKHCHQIGLANRILMIVANDTQRQQIVNDFAGDCLLVGAPCDGGVWSFERSAGDLRMAQLGEVQVFVCTVQQLEASMSRGGLNTLKDLLQVQGTKWLVGFDEFHHYGEAMAWGDAAKLAMEHAQVSLAMSATPYRRGADTIFPESRLCVSYREAEEDRCVKPMVCHSYEYSVAVIQDGEEVANYTTTELHRMTDGKLDQWEERKNIRYSPQYLHPLIIHPIRRLREMRAQTGKRLQMLVRAMSCRHAKMVSEQIKQFADGLSVDWIGTGTSGRSDKENRQILSRFCPPKNAQGKRPDADIDVLVQVSMAGEGFDSVNVCEIIDLFPVSSRALSGRATQDKQFYGRGARIVSGAESLALSVNVPSDHPLHAWAGRSLATWMDACGSGNEVTPQEAPEAPAFDLWDFPELPKEREIELITVITDKRSFEAFKEEASKRRGYDPVNDEAELAELYKIGQNAFQKEQSKQTRAFQVREHLDALVGRIALIRAKQSEEVSATVIGRFKKEANAAIKKHFGRSREEMTDDELGTAAAWLRNYFQSLRGIGL